MRLSATAAVAMSASIIATKPHGEAAGTGAVSDTQWPRLPSAAQVSSGSVHAASQQIPRTQNVEAHWFGFVHELPSASGV
jgi:hypothetical protein